MPNDDYSCTIECAYRSTDGCMAKEIGNGREAGAVDLPRDGICPRRQYHPNHAAPKVVRITRTSIRN